MTASDDTPYHHGNLRAALVEAALEMLRADGPHAVGLRAVARAAGVSPAAPYAHFDGKPALMAEVAARGFDMLAAALAAARDGAGGDARTALPAMGEAYIAFALENPGLYRLMFGPAGALDVEAPAYRRASAAAFDVLRAGVGAVGGEDRGPEAGAEAVAAWGLVHGLATLLIDGRLAARWARAEARRACLDVLARRL